MINRVILCLLGVCMWSSCTDMLEQTQKTETETDKLVLSLSVDNHTATTGANDDSLNESLVKRVDVFFVDGSGNILYKFAERGSEEENNGKFTLASTGWKAEFTAPEYEVYVIANMHDVDNPATIGEKESDLSWVQTKAQLLALTDTDKEVAKTQGEISVEEGAKPYSQKTFLMNGKTTWNVENDRPLIDVNLAHAAAKISVLVSYTEDFLGPNGKPLRKVLGVQKKLVRYVDRAKAVAEGGEVALPNLQGDAGSSGFFKGDRNNGLDGTERKDELYAYTYPNDWSDDIEERETYLLINVPYVNGDGTGETMNNYYKIPVRVSGNAEDLCLKRNMEYRVNVTIDREGNPEVIKPVEISATFAVFPWKVQEVEVTDDAPKYLVLDRDTVEMHNIDETEIGFTSSSAITGITIEKAYFIDKNGNEDTTEEGTTDLKSIIKIYDTSGGALSGKIKVESPIPQNVTLRYIDATVTNDDGVSKPVHIIQYPPEYILGIPGAYATRDDFTNNTYYNFIHGVEMPSKDSFVLTKTETDAVHNGILTFVSKVYDSKNKYIAKVSVSNRPFKLGIGAKNSATLNNNRMYLVQVTSANSGHILGRPEKEEWKASEVGQTVKADQKDDNKVAVSSPENNKLVSPLFMLASHLGTTSANMNTTDDKVKYDWSFAQDHCRQYVEVIDYGNGEYRELKDWRLPSLAEFTIIAEKQNKAGEVMEVVVKETEGVGTSSPTYYLYWTLQEENYCYFPNNNADIKNKFKGYFTRCIRDVTPADLEEFRRHGLLR